MIIGVHTQSQAEKGAAFAKEQQLPYPVAFDTEGKTVKAFAVDSYPDYYLVDRAGRLRVADLANGELEKAIQLLLDEPAPEGAGGSDAGDSDASDTSGQG